MKMRNIFFGGMLVAASCFTANATITFTPGNNPSGDVNVLLTDPSTGTTVFGSASGQPQFQVQFSSSITLTEPSNGQARVQALADDTALTDLMISLTNNYGFGDLIINPFIGGGVGTFADTTVTVTAAEPGGAPNTTSTYTYPSGSGNGNNFLTIVASGGESIVSVAIASSGGFDDLRQPRISGPFTLLSSDVTGGVPEPATYALLASSLVGLGLFRRRKN